MRSKCLRQPGRLSEEVKLGLGFEKQTCIREMREGDRCTDMYCFMYVYPCAPLLIHTPPRMWIWVYVGMLSHFSRVHLFVTLWTVHQAPLSMGFSRQKYCSGLPYPPPGDLLNPGIKPTSLLSPALAGRFFTTTATCKKLVERAI